MRGSWVLDDGSDIDADRLIFHDRLDHSRCGVSLLGRYRIEYPRLRIPVEDTDQGSGVADHLFLLRPWGALGLLPLRTDHQHEIAH